MKKLSLLAFGLLLSLALGLNGAAEAQSNYTSSYWDYYRNYYSGENSRYSSARAYRPTYRSSVRRTYSPRISTSTRTTSPYYNPTQSRTSNYRVYPTGRSQVQTFDGVKAVVTPITLRQDINSVTSAPVDLFQIGLSYPGGSSSTFSPAAQVRQMQFQVQDNSGVVGDFSDFDLVIEDQSFQFERNGYITLNFNNLRLARGESRALEVQIKLNDPDTFPRLPGSFRVKMTGVTAVEEGSVRGIETSVTGRTVSDYVVLNPTPSVSGGGSDGNASATPVFIAGRALGASEKAVVLSAKLKASRDDFLVEKITVRNRFGDNIDSLIQEIRLINASAGLTLSSKRFTGGVATFDLGTQNQILIPRNGEVNLVFEVLVRSSLPSNIADNRLELTFNPADIDIFGIGSGRAVPNSSKNFNVDAETFTLNQGGGGGSVSGGIGFSAVQPSFVSNGSLAQIVRFQIRNGGTQGMSLGRLTLQAFPSGVQYVGGISLDDAQLVRVIGGFQEYSSGFTTSGATSNTFTFDAASSVYLAPGETHEYALKLKLENIGDNEDSDAVAVNILGDSSFNKGTLASVRASGASFIWSDQSANPHSINSSDWLSGYLVSGLPTGNFVKYRR